jgi:hypothetical protein
LQQQAVVVVVLIVNGNGAAIGIDDAAPELIILRNNPVTSSQAPPLALKMVDKQGGCPCSLDTRYLFDSFANRSIKTIDNCQSAKGKANRTSIFFVVFSCLGCF